MFRTTLTKTIYTKRWMIVSWTLGILALVVFTVIFYPSLSKSFGESLKDVPESLRAFIGDASAYSNIAGYTDLQVFSQLVFMTLILGIILFTGLIAGEENEGTLQTLLVQPTTRRQVYFQKLFAAVALLAVACLGLLAGILIGALIIGEHIDIGRALIATLASLLITLVFSVFGYMLGAATGRRGIAGGLAGVFAFTSLLISSLAGSVSSLRFVDKFSPFHYFNKPGIMQYGPNWEHILLLAVSVVVMAWLGAVFFGRRDIYQR